jgi:RNA polymerase sigma-70 factor (ECF subfamily)
VYRFAYRLAGSPDLAAETVQETFVALIGLLDRYDSSRGSLAAFLAGIARNKLRRLVDRDWNLAAFEAGQDPETGGGVETVEREHTAGRVRRSVASLPLAYREAVVLCDLEGMRYEEAAAALGVPVGTVRSRLSRGREMLAERLAPAGKGA